MKRTGTRDKALKAVIWACALFTLSSLLLIIGYVVVRGIGGISWEFLTTMYKPGLEQYGIYPMIISTLMLVAVSIFVATPIGVGAAVYLSEYARRGRALEVINFAIDSLAGIPSILYGLFGYSLFVLALGLKYSLLSGGLTVSIMILPTIIRTTQEALRSVPDSYREGSLALGAGKLTTIARVVLPNARAGMLTSIILSVGRVAGETAALIYTMGTATTIADSLSTSGQTLSVHMYLLAKEGLDFNQAFSVALVLVVIVAVINALAGLAASLGGKRRKA